MSGATEVWLTKTASLLIFLAPQNPLASASLHMLTQPPLFPHMAEVSHGVVSERCLAPKGEAAKAPDQMKIRIDHSTASLLPYSTDGNRNRVQKPRRRTNKLYFLVGAWPSH